MQSMSQKCLEDDYALKRCQRSFTRIKIIIMKMAIKD